MLLTRTKVVRKIVSCDIYIKVALSEFTIDHRGLPIEGQQSHFFYQTWFDIK